MGRRKLVRILLEYGYTAGHDANSSENAATNIDALNLQHERAVDIAQRKEHKEIVEMLKNPGKIVANPNITSSGIGVELNEDELQKDVQENVKTKYKPNAEKTFDKKKKKKYQKSVNHDKPVNIKLIKRINIPYLRNIYCIWVKIV